MQVTVNVNVCGDCPHNQKGEGVSEMRGGVVTKTAGYCTLGNFGVVNELPPPNEQHTTEEIERGKKWGMTLGRRCPLLYPGREGT